MNIIVAWLALSSVIALHTLEIKKSVLSARTRLQSWILRTSMMLRIWIYIVTLTLPVIERYLSLPTYARM